MSHRLNHDVHAEGRDHVGIRVVGARRRQSLAMAAIRQSLSRLYSISIVLSSVLRKEVRVVYIVILNTQSHLCHLSALYEVTNIHEL